MNEDKMTSYICTVKEVDYEKLKRAEQLTVTRSAVYTQRTSYRQGKNYNMLLLSMR